MEEREGVFNLVRRAIGDEWLANIQYSVGAVLIDDENEDAVLEFVEHAGDEWDHAMNLSAWLQDASGSGGIPRSPTEILKNQTCGYIYPSGNSRWSLVHEAIRAETCAIGFYQDLIKGISGTNFHWEGLGDILDQILEKEKEHLRDLEKL